MALSPAIFGILFIANFHFTASTNVSTAQCTTLASGISLDQKTSSILRSNPTCQPTNGLCYHYSRQVENSSRTVEHFGCDDQLNSDRFTDLRLLVQALPHSETELCSYRRDDQICVCRATNASNEPCNAKWIEHWRYRGLLPHDWPWLLGTVALWTAGLMAWIGWLALRKGNPVMEVQNETHVYIAKPLSRGWHVFNASIIFVQVIQILSCFIQIVLLWDPIFVDCPQDDPPQRFVPEYASTFQLINDSATLREISLTTWPQPLAVRLMTLKIGCFATVVFAVYLMWQIAFFKSILSRRYPESGLILCLMHCVYSLMLAFVSSAGTVYTFETVVKQACAEHEEHLKLKVFQINFYIYLSFAAIEIVQLSIFNIKFWSVFFDKRIKEQASEKSESDDTIFSVCTAISHHSEIVNDLLIDPVPFILTDYRETNKICLFNGYTNQWLAVRLLTKVPGIYTISPDKITIPPRRPVTVSIQRGPIDPLRQADCAILAQYFLLDDDYIFTPARHVWLRPHVVPRQRWMHKLIVVLYQLESN